MKTHHGDPISPEMEAQLKRLEDMTDADIDLSDMPETLDWSHAIRGKYYRPVKKPYSLRLDEDVVAWFKAGGSGYQTRINAALREYVLNHSKKSA
jgi:uncharacterized protein (DUF4415 family)